jgi:hypothetical protein
VQSGLVLSRQITNEAHDLPRLIVNDARNNVLHPRSRVGSNGTLIRLPAIMKKYGPDAKTHDRATESPGREVAFYQPKPAATVALSSQYWVCSSVQPGTAKRAGAVIR